jgi:CRISPR-associated protein Cas2
MTMLMMLLEKVPAAARGELSRWLIEVDPGVFIGHVSARVRDLLWEKSCSSRGSGRVFQAWTTNNEQHFKMRVSGYDQMQVVDWEGVQLLQKGTDELSKPQRKRIQNQ